MWRRTVDNVAIQVIVSVGSVFTGQNIAKNQYDRIREALYKTLAVMVEPAFVLRHWC